jgi:hypothetical protein
MRLVCDGVNTSHQFVLVDLLLRTSHGLPIVRDHNHNSIVTRHSSGRDTPTQGRWPKTHGVCVEDQLVLLHSDLLQRTIMLGLSASSEARESQQLISVEYPQRRGDAPVWWSAVRACVESHGGGNNGEAQPSGGANVNDFARTRYWRGTGHQLPVRASCRRSSDSRRTPLRASLESDAA